MTIDFQSQRLAVPTVSGKSLALHAMLEAKSVAIVGASARADSFGRRMLAEVAKSPAKPTIYPVNPRYPHIDGRRCLPSLADLPEPADLVLLGVPDAILEQQLRLAADTGCRSAVIFGNAHDPTPSALRAPSCGYSDSKVPTMHGVGLRERLAAIAYSAGMELCGAGCMGFANVSYGLRAMGYVEPDPLPAGPVALVTHSGSVFSALMRSRRGIGFTLAVSSGQELVTAAPSYLAYALDQPGTRVLALVLEAMRQPERLRDMLALASERALPVVLLTAGSSASGQDMVAAHSGALAGSDAGWEALTRAYGIHRVRDLAEMADTLEVFALRTTRAAPGQGPTERSGRGPTATFDPNVTASATGTGDRTAKNRVDVPLVQKELDQWHIDPISGGDRRRGIATVHDSGLERAHAADLADNLGVPFATISDTTASRLAGLLDPGLAPANPLDVWGTGANTRELFANCLLALADDESVDVVALAVDLITELDGDDSYHRAALDAAARTRKPLVVISGLASAIDRDAASLLRQNGIPVLEGTRPGLLALRHLLDQLRRHRGSDAATTSVPADSGRGNSGRGNAGHASSLPASPHSANAMRRDRATKILAEARQSGAAQLALLREYGIRTAVVERVTSADAAISAARQIGYPVVLKTDNPAIAHKSDARGVILGIANDDDLAVAYASLASRLGPAALVCQTISEGVELAFGMTRDRDLGPLIVVGAGGTLVEFIADRAVALPPVSHAQAAELIEGLSTRRLLTGVRGAAPADLGAVASAIAGMSDLIVELGDRIDALDINPLICGPLGAVAVDALIIQHEETQ